ncbi:hypothetical protein CHS0354_014538 [Potamilus streckersoni]|uniref:Uncharacterized protein n=1 Tax=Potamilus streckersoni TaxID=2493646 RepID=A0AAE0S9R7_9BIVA|nr:hypothetical protein CHS0354_014538 [Potamilus streckersoni]
MNNVKVDGHATVMLRLFAFVIILPPLCTGASVENKGNFGASSFINNHSDLLVLVTFVVLSIVIVFLCGGCTDIEVSTDTHPACGDSRSKRDYSSIGMGGATVVTEIYDPNRQQVPLPYSLSPQILNTANTFVGYESSTLSAQAYLPGNNVRPTAPSAQDCQPTRIGPGVHHPVGESEMPPPSYSEAVGASRSYQNYGF